MFMQGRAEGDGLLPDDWYKSGACWKGPPEGGVGGGVHENKEGRGNFYYVIKTTLKRSEKKEGERQIIVCVYHVPASSLGFLVVDSDWLG